LTLRFTQITDYNGLFREKKLINRKTLTCLCTTNSLTRFRLYWNFKVAWEIKPENWQK